MKGAGKPRPGAVRKTGHSKQATTGGHGRQALEGKGPTPKAEDRAWHPAGKRKAAEERYLAAGGKGRSTSTGGRGGPRGGAADGQNRGRLSGQRRGTSDAEVVTGRNSVVEALRAHIPATTLYVATRIEMDDRVREALRLATNRQIPVLELTKPELDRLAGEGGVHQGLALKVPPYQYVHPLELLDEVIAHDELPLIVALDGITDPRNLGAILRSVGAFGGHGVVLPQRRSVAVNAAAWKTSAGAAARVPVAMASNLTQTLKAYKERGLFVVGLDGDGETQLPGITWSDRPLVIVVGSEGKGLSRLVTETCDAVVSIPISATTESLNAGIATSVALYEISKLRAH